MNPVEIHVSPEARRLCAALAASDWPEREQAVKPYRPHRVAALARETLAALRAHPAIAEAMRAVDEAGPDTALRLALERGSPLAFALDTFEREASLDVLWARTAADWAQAEADLTSVLARADLAGLLDLAFGDVPRPLRLMPNLLYPGARSLAAVSPDGVTVLVPPPKAWGSSLPWRYSERADESLAEIAAAFARALFDEAAPAASAKSELAGKALAALILRDAEGPSAEESYLLMERRSNGVAQLPEALRTVEAHLADRRAGRTSNIAQKLFGI